MNASRGRRPELDADARRGPDKLGHAVQPGPLAAAAHGQQITPTGREDERSTAHHRTQHKSAWRAYRDDGDHRIVAMPADPIAVRCDAVLTVPIPCE